MWQEITFTFGGERFDLTAYVPSRDLWDVLAKFPQPTPNHVLAQIADDGPFRWGIPTAEYEKLAFRNLATPEDRADLEEFHEWWTTPITV